MGLCIGILENQLAEAAEYLDLNKYVFKFLKDSEEYEDYLNSLKIKTLTDCLLFSGSNSYLRALRFKTNGKETETHVKDMVAHAFYDERQIAIVNDFFDNPHMVLVFPTIFEDTTRKEEEIGITLKEEISIDIMNNVLDNLEKLECIPTITLERFKLDVMDDDVNNLEMFRMRQQKIKIDNQIRYKEQLVSNFKEAFKFRMITYYTKLREFGLEDIMRKLDEMGYLDERFKGDVFIYEEEARRILARRLCAISYKNDIELLMSQGILKPEMLSYSLDV